MTAALLASLAALATFTPPLPFELSVGGSRAAVKARDFEATWDADRGGTVASLRVRDWHGLNEVAAGALGDLVVEVDGHTYRLSATRGSGTWQVEKLGPGKERLVLSKPVLLRSDDGAASPVMAEQAFTLFAEGAVFCDVTLRLAAEGAAGGKLESCRLEFPCATGRLHPMRHYCVRGWEHLDRTRAVTDLEEVTHAGFMFGHGKGYCAATEFVLENQRCLAGEGKPLFSALAEAGGSKVFLWKLYSGPPVPLLKTALATKKGFHFRWGLAVSHLPQRSLAIGQRVAHWQEGQANLMSFPSDDAIEAMKLAGVTVNVLHLYWSKGWARNHRPVDEPEMRRWVASCKAQGIRPVLYVVPVDAPGVDGINSSWYDDYGIGGLYFDFGAIGFNTAHYKTDYPALQYLELTRHYRDVVGPDGLMISHCSGQFPDVVFLRNIDAYLPGEASRQGLMLKGWDRACWFGGLATAVSHPWCEYRPWQTKHATALFAAIGAFPHVLFGRGTHEDNNYHRCVIKPAGFVLPYWQMLRTLPMDRDTIMYNEATQRVAQISAPEAHWVVYSRGQDAVLAVVSNLGPPTSVRLTLDRKALGLSGEYGGYVLYDDVLQAPKPLAWTGGPFDLGRLGTDDYRAVTLARRGSAAERELRRRLAEIAELRRQLTNKRPPGPVSDLQATADLGLVSLTWKKAPSAAHICEYRVERLGAPEPLPAAEECTYLRDVLAPPGTTARYTVQAVDVAGTRGPARSVAVKVPAGDLFCATFDRGQGPVKAMAGAWAVEQGWLRGGAPLPIAPAGGTRHEFEARQARYVRIYFAGGRFNYDNGHLIEARVLGAKGQPLHVARVASSGADPDHPVSEVCDGITDQSH
ncbi:MAG: hypothetical protein J7M26_10370, partial [Armatimonadetes bacterium]|nr:hypothetical protein [Armatimonadota bacterium]